MNPFACFDAYYRNWQSMLLQTTEWLLESDLATENEVTYSKTHWRNLVHVNAMLGKIWPRVIGILSEVDEYSEKNVMHRWCVYYVKGSLVIILFHRGRAVFMRGIRANIFQARGIFVIRWKYYHKSSTYTYSLCFCCEQSRERSLLTFYLRRAYVGVSVSCSRDCLKANCVGANCSGRQNCALVSRLRIHRTLTQLRQYQEYASQNTLCLCISIQPYFYHASLYFHIRRMTSLPFAYQTMTWLPFQILPSTL